MCVAQNDGATSGQIARKLGVGLSTITGVVDRLAEQHLVTRGEDADDRRITRVLPTARGRTLVDDLLRYRNELITAVLSRLDADQLRTIETAFTYLLQAVNEVADERQHEEAVA
jgi:DNA-binding MarR family transcriptional regulator